MDEILYQLVIVVLLISSAFFGRQYTAIQAKISLAKDLAEIVDQATADKVITQKEYEAAIATLKKLLS